MKQWLRNFLASIKAAPATIDPVPKNYKFNLREAKVDFEKAWKDNSNEYTARLSDFELIRVIGHGKFGHVVFAKYKKLGTNDPEAFVAVKIISKQAVVKDRGPEHVSAEKKCLKAIRNPFFIKYKHHFKDNANMFLVTEYVPGGDLFTRLKRIQRYEQSHVIFYSAQIVLAFEYLHYMGVIYRDLKPENVLLDQMGYLKLGDLGLCKKIDLGSTKTMCGTPEYLAPEVIYGRAYSYPVDWWALGILIFELIYGQTPFRTKNLVHLLRKIVNANVVFFPKPEINVDSRQLITELLRKHITERLSDPPAIKKMPYFEGINWPSLYDRRIPAPYVPVIESVTDTSHFDEQPELHIEESETDLFSDAFKDF